MSATGPLGRGTISSATFEATISSIFIFIGEQLRTMWRCQDADAGADVGMPKPKPRPSGEALLWSFNSPQFSHLAKCEYYGVIASTHQLLPISSWGLKRPRQLPKPSRHQTPFAPRIPPHPHPFPSHPPMRRTGPERSAPPGSAHHNFCWGRQMLRLFPKRHWKKYIKSTW